MPRRRALLALAAAAATSSPAWAESRPPAIAAASDLHFAIEELAAAFRSAGHGTVRVTLGSSGHLTRQIERGAPFELFLSADESFVARLAERGLTRDGGTLYAVGRIVLFAPDGAPFEADGALDGLAAAVASGRVSRFAIASPEHAPYGRAAMQALTSRGLWEALRPALVFGENVAQAAQFAASGNAEGGIISYSFALAPPIARLGRFALIPEAWHEPLRQRMVLLRRAGPVAERFFAFLQEEPARAIFARHGFTRPGA